MCVFSFYSQASNVGKGHRAQGTGRRVEIFAVTGAARALVTEVHTPRCSRPKTVTRSGGAVSGAATCWPPAKSPLYYLCEADEDALISFSCENNTSLPLLGIKHTEGQFYFETELMQRNCIHVDSRVLWWAGMDFVLKVAWVLLYQKNYFKCKSTHVRPWRLPRVSNGTDADWLLFFVRRKNKVVNVDWNSEARTSFK
jgi:hypothetical protein